MNTFNNRFINSWKELQHAVVGLELEWFSNHSLIKTVELLNLEFDPIEIYFMNTYHSGFKVTDKKWVIEPDYSGGSEMIELITGPMPWVSARTVLIKMLSFIKKYGYTNDYCSIHINISFDNINVKELNPVKLILNFSEDFVYDKFPNRRSNIYARSIKWIMPFEDWDDSEVALNSIIQCVQIPDDTKYYGINLQKKWKGYLEYRYIGGAEYENKSDEILSLMDYFILQTKKAIVEELLPEDNIKLLSYLEDNINWFKQYKTYDEFLANIDSINIEIDQVSQYELVKATWDKFKNKLFQIIKSCDSIKDATINYNSTSNKLEIVNAVMTNIHYLKGVDFIGCKINECTLYDCQIVDTEIEGGHIYNSKVYESKIISCKLSNCDALEWTELIKCMFDGGKIDCIMKDGVFRSGEIGENAQIDMTVKMANKDSFWSLSPTDKLVKGLKK